MSSTLDSDGETEPESNPVKRRMLYRFNDGQWWTADGIAHALAGEVLDELAVRFYQSVSTTGRPPPGNLAKQIATSRRIAVQRCLNPMVREKLAELDKRDGENFYLIKVSESVRFPSQVVLVQTKPSTLSWSGLTRPGVLDAIQKLGQNGMTDRRLLEVVAGLFRHDFVEQYRKIHTARVEKGKLKTSLDGKPEHEVRQIAMAYALSEILQDLRVQKQITTFTQIIIRPA